MTWADILAGFAFYLILEGVVPFASPRNWRRGLYTIAQLSDEQLRAAGLAITVTGLILFYFVRS